MEKKENWKNDDDDDDDEFGPIVCRRSFENGNETIVEKKCQMILFLCKTSANKQTNSQQKKQF